MESADFGKPGAALSLKETPYEPGIFVEDAVQDDAGALRDHQLCHAREVENLHLDSVRVLEGVLAVFAKPQLGFYLVARDSTAQSSRSGAGHASGDIVGSLLVTQEWSDWRARFFWWIQSVYVEPKFRGHGVFSKLYAEVEGRARQSGAAGVRLYVEHGNRRAQAVYEHLGLQSDRYVMFEKHFS